MIVSKTPVRISFVGGGSDLPAFYQRHGGAVVSTTINRYVYITVNRKFDNGIRVSYSKTEEVSNAAALEHNLVRAALLKLGIPGGIEITSIADIPSHGTGLGSSSSFTVGLLNALHAYCGRFVGRAALAAEACEVEIDICGAPIGKQDQYAGAVGGFNFLRFNPDETVDVVPLAHMRPVMEALRRSLIMFYTGVTRSASGILAEQRARLQSDGDRGEATAHMKRMVELAGALKSAIENADLTSFGEIMHEAWLLKRGLASGITSAAIDDWYQRARTAGASGGKILGAGGGGFLLMVAPPERQEAVIDALPELRPIDFRFDTSGTTIVFSETNA